MLSAPGGEGVKAEWREARSVSNRASVLRKKTSGMWTKWSLNTMFFFFFFNIYLFIWLHQVLVVACRIFIAMCRSFVAMRGIFSCGMWNLVP